MQEIIERARDEVLNQQQEIKRLTAGLLALEQRFFESLPGAVLNQSDGDGRGVESYVGFQAGDGSGL